jgi:hypothetical protein
MTMGYFVVAGGWLRLVNPGFAMKMSKPLFMYIAEEH